MVVFGAGLAGTAADTGPCSPASAKSPSPFRSSPLSVSSVAPVMVVVPVTAASEAVQELARLLAVRDS